MAGDGMIGLLRRPAAWLAVLVIAGLIVRAGLVLAVVDFPGIADPNHYYHMAVNVADGRGFVIDYVWQFNRPPADLSHPEDHWLPLTAAIAALPMAALNTRAVDAALIGFVVIGALLPVLVYVWARQLGLTPGTALVAALFAAFLPEFVLNSVRTDTTLPAAAAVTGAIVLLTHGLHTGRTWAYAGAGIAAGLAYLTRSDGVLVVLAGIAGAIGYWLLGGERRRPAALIVFPLLAALTVAPWLLRNYQLFGTFGSAETSKMFFFTDHLDHYAVERAFTLETLLAAQTPAQIVSKRVFEFAAGGQMAIATADAAIVPLIGGALLLIARRDRARLRVLLPALLLVIGAFVAYAVFIPYKAQAGSLKKAWLMSLPLLLPIAALALERAIADRRLRYGAAALISLILLLNAVQLVRTDQRTALGYRASIADVVAALNALPDVTGDGERVIMTQDPYIFSYFGVRSVMFPHEPIAIVADVARRYNVDYLLFPADRPALDPVYAGTETTDAFTFVSSLHGTPYEFWQVTP